MGMDMRTRRTVVKEAAKRYRRARKKDKGRLLDEFVALTGYNRCYAARVLRGAGKRRYQPTVRRCRRLGKRGRKKKYGPEVLGQLRKIWGILDFACGKRMVANMDEMISVLTRFKELDVSDEVRDLLVSISASTADRLLAGDRRRLELKGRSGTKPGSLLKYKIPICTFADWDDADVGFLQVDLVGHEGGNSRGDFCQSLSATDVATGWTEIRGLRNKAQVWTFEALKDVRADLPFPLLGINSDTGSEFINNHLWRYCKAEKITFTRCRTGRKNDNCYVEQKNYTAVRQTVGYFRYDTQKELDLLRRIYSIWRLYANFFLPQMKLLDKIREGSKVKKRYDRPQTPYARVLASRHVSRKVKAQLRKQYVSLNPAKLRRDMLNLQKRLYKVAASKRRYQITNTKSEDTLAYAATP
jgi:hypothetical protein